MNGSISCSETVQRETTGAATEDEDGFFQAERDCIGEESVVRIPRSVALIGGMGRMGRLFGRLLTDAGVDVEIFDPQCGGIDWHEAASHDVAIIAVPISAVEPVVRNLGPYTRSDGAVIDISSVKRGPVAAMLEHCRGEVIGTHPLFGPDIEDFTDHTVFTVAARSGPWGQWFRNLLEDRGCRLVATDPDEHDRLMAAVQFLRHMLLTTFGRTLSALDPGIEQKRHCLGPWFGQLLDQLERFRGQPPELYAEIAAHTVEAQHVADVFGCMAADTAAGFASGDADRLTAMFDEFGNVFETD